jgi:hypothetical protein
MIHINYVITCEASQNKNVMIFYFILFFGNEPFGWPITKTIRKSASHPQVKIAFFTLFYIVI